MKKFLASLLAAALMLSLTVGCGETPAPKKDKDAPAKDAKPAADKDKKDAK